MKKARIRLLYEDKKQLDYILKHNKYAHKYFDFTPKKWSFKNAPTEQDDRYIDRQYLYEQAGNYDGVMALLDGNELEGVYGNYQSIKGKIIMQTEFQEGVYRTWREKSVTERVKSYLKGDGIGKWKLSKTKRKTKYYQPIYSFDHESGHGASSFYGIKDKLHYYVNEKQYEKFWEYLSEQLSKPVIKFHKATHKWFGTWRITQGFGENKVPFYREMGLKGHNGLDFASPIGWKMYFNVEGDTNWTCYNYDDKYGKKIVSISDEKVNLGNGVEEYVGVIHLHIKESKVKDGQKIKFGDYFAITGNTGFLSTGAHTHEALKITDKRGYAKNSNNGYNGAIDHLKYYAKFK